ncbi:hypothetical protein A1O3_01969 [Capronia epimyces CBS 606.96]|uniref:Zn(2)-C6 fungal-type domain-containing protein n=1 Tax=Capronia epimyces CBS 606.96 TaxID=1182542 RepID=W9YGY5_9EURO|nr:uncharacterized protein A1O3_01969 [Capronia epimyces CBS 606.96]EXJ88905.1 hypothetical protein A1O3_01969 [Capronia epimyces CBS 606.96]
MDQRNVLIKRVRRRQHSSCDQCRKAKRACDAAFQAEHEHFHHASPVASTPRHTAHQGKPQIPVARCSNCQKAGRNCTFEWLECALPKANKGIKKKSQPRNDIDASREGSTAHFSTQKPAYASTLGSDPDFFADLGTANLGLDHIDDADLFDIWRSPDILFDHGVSAAHFDGFTNPCAASNPIPSTNKPPPMAMARSWIEDEPELPSLEDIQDQEVMDLEEQSYQEGGQGLYPTDPWFQEPETSLLFANSECSSVPMISDDEISSSLLSTSTLSSGTNRWLLAQNWLRVYHDSLENALSCWLTERNCPYTLARNDADGLAGVWGPQWSNRIYKRVCSLDRFVNDLPGRSPSRTENSMAGKALNAAVMAFGVQWAQAGDRASFRDRISSFMATSSVHNAMNLPAADGFGRSVQETLWYQARQALQDAAGIQSYRVAFANIVFSLTQRPLNLQDWAQSTTWKPRNENQRCASSVRSGLTPQSDSGGSGLRDRGLGSRWDALQEIINADGPPIFLEAASRQLISSRWQWERYNRQKAKETVRSPSGSHWERGRASTASVTPSRKHRETFQLLSWLAIMFDTISAAILQRPPVVPDEDTGIDSSDPWETTPQSPPDLSDDDFSASSARDIDLDGWDPVFMSPKPQKQLGSSDIWDSFFLQSQDLEDGNESQRSYKLDDAASILCDAAPVKVLLFRKVGHIQKLMSRRAGSEALEQAVEKALRVYAFWNRSYGRFIAQCMTRHHDLPARIQSWYLVLAGHWHLGTILLADVVEEMDEAGLSRSAQRDRRRMSNFSNDMRRKNATAISELCRCSLHGDSLSFPTAREFTFPVNQVALLSEPWTLVLIQSFSRAGYVFVSQLIAPRRWRNAGWSTVEDERNLAKRRCGYCIEGLLNLGNKSDMAYLAGKFLKDCLNELDE